MPVCGLSTTLWPPSGWGCLLLTNRSYPLPQYKHVWVLSARCLVIKPTPEFPIFGSDRISAVCCLLVIAAQWFCAVRSLQPQFPTLCPAATQQAWWEYLHRRCGQIRVVFLFFDIFYQHIMGFCWVSGQCLRTVDFGSANGGLRVKSNLLLAFVTPKSCVHVCINFSKFCKRRKRRKRYKEKRRKKRKKMKRRG